MSLLLPKEAHNLIPRTYECVTFHGKRASADVVDLMHVEMGTLSWIILAGTV